MPLFQKDDKKKKTIPKDKILKAVKGQSYVDLGEPFGENARRYLSYQIMKMIEQKELTGTVVTPEGIYISLSNKEVKDIIRLINAKGLCSLNELAIENKWDIATVNLIANTRVELFSRSDGKVITRDAAKEILYQKILQGTDVDIQEVADEILIKRSLVKDLLDTLIADKKIDGFYIKSSHKFIPMEMLEESIKEFIEDLEMKKIQEVTFATIAEEYSITEEAVYNLLLKLYNKGDIDVQLNLGQKRCLLKSNIQATKFKERIPDEEKKLDIEDLSQKNRK
ncbi:MAG: hypothetical protein ACFFDW_12365 [Candidatus Thorarchaeota archaeon]